MIGRVRELVRRLRTTSRRNAAIRREVRAHFAEVDAALNRAGVKRPRLDGGVF